MEFRENPQSQNRSNVAGEYITTVHGVPIFELDTSFTDNEKMILNFGNPVFTPDELREIADAVEDFYSEPTFEERVENVADEFGLYVENVNMYEDNFADDARISWTEEDEFDRVAVFEALDEFCQSVSFNDSNAWVEEERDS